MHGQKHYQTKAAHTVCSAMRDSKEAKQIELTIMISISNIGDSLNQKHQWARKKRKNIFLATA